ncbi:MAG: hypothetical protein ABFS32_11720 [Bacteroidota bacterium]
MKKVNSIQTLVQKSIFGLGTIMLVILLILSMSCTTELDSVNSINQIDEAAVAAELIAQADFEEIDDMSSNAMVATDGSTGGRVTGYNDDRLNCAIVNHDFENNTITIDFGEGCTGPNGVERSGMIIITYDGRRFMPGSSWSITFENFYINDRHIEGTRTTTNISETLLDSPKFHITLENGKVTWPDSTFATREVDRVRVWNREDNPLMDQWLILAESTTEGVNRREVNYSTLVLEDLVYQRSCRGPHKGRIPVAGVKEVTLGEDTFTVDFGDGECDTIVTITAADGESKEIDLSDR